MKIIARGSFYAPGLPAFEDGVVYEVENTLALSLIARGQGEVYTREADGDQPVVHVVRHDDVVGLKEKLN
jgi:hypothetical protein